METFRHRIDAAAAAGTRVDRYIADHLGLFSRSQLKQRVSKVLVNGRESKLSRKVYGGDSLVILYREPEPTDVLPEPIPLDVLYEDRDVIVVNKPSGMIVHPAGRVRSGTLVNALLHHCREVREDFPGEPLRPGIVHRLDKDTSGVLIAAKNVRSREFLAAQFRARTARKLYWAVVRGTPPRTRGRIETLLARDPHHRKRFTTCCSQGKKAVTDYRILQQFKGYTLLALRPRTGRTHQIRVHCLSMHCPVLGDPLYARRDATFPQAPMMLHAAGLTLRLPGGSEDRRRFRAPLPDHFRRLLAALRTEGI